MHYFEHAKFSNFENPDQVRTKFISTWYLPVRYHIASTWVLDAWYLIKVREACLWRAICMVPEYLKFLVGTRCLGSQDLLAITSLQHGGDAKTNAMDAHAKT